MNVFDFQSGKISDTILSRRDKLDSWGLSSSRLVGYGFDSHENMRNDSTKNCKAV